jgi:hypothetical protein
MNHDYDLFEKFSDGSSIWRDSISGFRKARLRLQELAQGSENRFYAIDLTTGEVLGFDRQHDNHGLREVSQTERRSKSQAA